MLSDTTDRGKLGADPSSRLQVVEGVVRLRFLGVVPGRQYGEGAPSTDTDNLYSYLRQQGLLGPKARSYKAFGLYDCVIIEEEQNYRRALSFLPLPPAVSHARTVMCFKLTSPASNWLANLPAVLGVSFLKLNRSALPPIPLTAIEQSVVALQQECRKPDKKVSLHAVLGAFGWHELVLVAGAAKFSDLLDFIFDLRTIPCPGATDRPLFDDTYTIPLLDYATSKEGESSTEDPLHVSILVEVKPGYEAAIQSALNQRSDARVGVAYGGYDIKIDFEGSVQLNDVLALTRLLHTSCRDIVLSTNTQMSRPVRTPETSFQRPKVTAPRPIELGANWRDYYERLLTNKEMTTASVARESAFMSLCTVFQMYNAALANHSEIERYEGLKDFMNGLKRSLSGEVDHRDGQKMQKLHTSLVSMEHVFRLGFAQRSGGIGRKSWLSEDMASGQLSGFGKLLDIAGVVPRYVYGVALDCGVWPGFVVTGAGNTPAIYSYGIINLPTMMLLKPRWWWHLAHEAAHHWAVVKHLTEYMVWDEARREGMEVGDPKDEYKRNLLLRETFCEWVTIRATFGSDWEAYLHWSWRSFSKAGWLREAETRSDFAAWLTIVGYLEGKCDLDEASLNNVLNNKAMDLSKAGLFKLSTNEVSEVIQWLQSTKPWIDLVKQVAGPKIVTSQVDQGQLQDWGRLLLEGSPIPDVENPLLAIRAALQVSDQEWNAKSAVANAALILTLATCDQKLRGSVK